MVRKIIGTLTGVLLLLCGAAATASAASVYEGTMSSTFISIAEDINISVVDDYVFFRSGQYSYILIVGDLQFSDGNFSLINTGSCYEITQVNGTGYSSNYYSYSVSEISSYTVETNGILVYSNLGDYPTLSNTGDVYVFLICFVFSVFCIGSLIRPLFNFVLRSRKGS